MCRTSLQILTAIHIYKVFALDSLKKRDEFFAALCFILQLCLTLVQAMSNLGTAHFTVHLVGFNLFLPAVLLSQSQYKGEGCRAFCNSLVSSLQIAKGFPGLFLPHRLSCSQNYVAYGHLDFQSGREHIDSRSQHSEFKQLKVSSKKHGRSVCST